MFRKKSSLKTIWPALPPTNWVFFNCYWTYKFRASIPLHRTHIFSLRRSCKWISVFLLKFNFRHLNLHLEFLFYHHHKHQGLDSLIRSDSTVTAARANASSVFQLFSFLVVCSGMISNWFVFQILIYFPQYVFRKWIPVLLLKFDFVHVNFCLCVSLDFVYL